jgi:hypothetical protein
MDLTELIHQLIEEEGLTPEEAARVAAATISAQKRSIEKSPGQQEHRSSIQNDSRGVDYGEETPEEAKQRWIEQERRDPNGIYSLGGSTASGIFGDQTIALEDYDPGAVQRNLDGHVKLQQAQVQAQQLEVQRETLRLLQDLGAGRQLPPQQERPPQLDQSRGNRRRLGRKRRR